MLTLMSPGERLEARAADRARQGRVSRLGVDEGGEEAASKND